MAYAVYLKETEHLRSPVSLPICAVMAVAEPVVRVYPYPNRSVGGVKHIGAKYAGVAVRHPACSGRIGYPTAFYLSASTKAEVSATTGAIAVLRQIVLASSAPRKQTARI